MKRIGLKLDGKRTPRQGMAVTKGGATIGEVTSGCLSPSLDYPIAMAFVPTDSCEVGDTLAVKLSETASADAVVVPMPFYKK
jgi:aminomethyltransferase